MIYSYKCPACGRVYNPEDLDSRPTFEDEVSAICPDCGHDAELTGRDFIPMRTCQECGETFPDSEEHKCKEE